MHVCEHGWMWCVCMVCMRWVYMMHVWRGKAVWYQIFATNTGQLMCGSSHCACVCMERLWYIYGEIKIPDSVYNLHFNTQVTLCVRTFGSQRVRVVSCLCE